MRPFIHDRTPIIGAGSSLAAVLIGDNGALVDLGTLPGHGYVGLPYSIGWGINRTGTIVGESKSQAMKYEDGAMEGFSRRSARAGYDINDQGDIVGLLESMSQRPHAFLYSDNNLLDLGTLDGEVYGTISATGC